MGWYMAQQIDRFREQLCNACKTNEAAHKCKRKSSQRYIYIYIYYICRRVQPAHEQNQILQGINQLTLREIRRRTMRAQWRRPRASWGSRRAMGLPTLSNASLARCGSRGTRTHSTTLHTPRRSCRTWCVSCFCAFTVDAFRGHHNSDRCSW